VVLVGGDKTRVWETEPLFDIDERAIVGFFTDLAFCLITCLMRIVDVAFRVSIHTSTRASTSTSIGINTST
jgi:hypothetical protein